MIFNLVFENTANECNYILTILNVFFTFRSGIIVAGDRILSINGNTLSTITCENLNKELKEIGPEETCFLMEYDISVMG